MVLCLLWTTAVVVSFYLISEVHGEDGFPGVDFWIIVFFSLLILMMGLVALFGRIKVFFLFSFPAVLFYSEVDTSKYNVEKASLVLGILTAALSYVLPFAPIGGLIAVLAVGIIFIAFVIGVIYVFAAKRFRTNMQLER
ncbi:MAG: hypothetical protein FWG41_05390 [Methanomassiliicoccaceae archaeon]|nr:hypothetical protein [Methanomassiliicoccaceae archaeon]